MNSHFGAKKDTAFLLIVTLGACYALFLSILTAKILPHLYQQLIQAWQLLSVDCSPQTLLAASGLYAGVIMGLFVMGLWLKVLWAVLRTLFTMLRTRDYLSRLQLQKVSDSLSKVLNGEVTAFTAGLLKPRIYLSAVLYEQFTESELRSIIAHETYHVNTHDPLRKLVTDFVKHALPVFPYKHSLFHNYEVLCELSADEYAEANMLTKQNIISALHKMFVLAESNLNLSLFGAKHDRIGILIGNESFHSRQFFGIILCAGLMFATNAMLLGHNNVYGNLEQAAVQITIAVDSLRGGQSFAGACNLPPVTAPDLQSINDGKSSHSPNFLN